MAARAKPQCRKTVWREPRSFPFDWPWRVQELCLEDKWGILGYQSKKPNLVLESAGIHEEFSQRSDWVRDGVGGGRTKYREGQRLGVFQIDPL